MDEPTTASPTPLSIGAYAIERELAPARTFLATAPGDPRGAELLHSLYFREPDELKKQAIRERMAELYPNSELAAELIGPKINP